MFPHNAVIPSLVKHSNSKFGELNKDDFPAKVEVSKEDIIRFSNRCFWLLVEEYIFKDVDILYRGLLKLNEL